MKSADVAVIIPTMASRQRALGLQRALDSLRAQSFGRARPIVVANGPHRDPEVMAALKRRTDVRLLELDEGSLPLALAAGRRLVDTEFFGTLDDDDEYLPTALAVRLEPFRLNATIDVVTTAGFGRAGERELAVLTEAEKYQRDPLAALMEVNWLESCGGLFRTRALEAKTFAAMPKYLEWTYLAAVLASRKEIAFVATPTYRKHVGTVGALSASRAYVLQGPRALKAIHALNLPRDIKKRLRQKYVKSLHSASDLELRSSNYASAWKYHLLSIGSTHGLRYVSYTRHLLQACGGALLRI